MKYESAFRLFEPAFIAMEEMVQDAFDKFYQLHRTELEVIRNRTRASEINDRITAGLFDVLSGIGSPRFVAHIGTAFILLEGKCLIRVKKLDGRGRASYHHTPSSLRFDCNGLLFDLPVEDRLYFGYVLNKHSGLPDSIVIAAPSDDRYLPANWMINVTEEAWRQGQFFRRPAVATPAVRPPVRPKEKPKEGGLQS